MPFEKSILFGDLPADANAMGMETIGELASSPLWSSVACRTTCITWWLLANHIKAEARLCWRKVRGMPSHSISQSTTYFSLDESTTRSSFELFPCRCWCMTLYNRERLWVLFVALHGDILPFGIAHTARQAYPSLCRPRQRSEPSAVADRSLVGLLGFQRLQAVHPGI